MSPYNLRQATELRSESVPLIRCLPLLGIGFWGNGVVFTRRHQGSSFLGFIFRTLKGNPKKELLWGLWVVLVGTQSLLYPLIKEYSLNHIRDRTKF